MVFFQCFVSALTVPLNKNEKEEKQKEKADKKRGGGGIGIRGRDGGIRRTR